MLCNQQLRSLIWTPIEHVGLPVFRRSDISANKRPNFGRPCRSMRRVVQPSALSVVVPAYNEARRLKDSLPRLLDLVTDTQAELIVVDDGGDDGTSAVAG